MKNHWLVFILCIAGTARAQFVVNTGLPLANSTSVGVNGDWDNKGASFLNNGIIFTSANWNSTGGYSALGTGGFVLTNSTTQQFNHSRQSVGVLKKNGAGITQVNNPLIVTDTLTLQNGLLAMTGVNLDTLVIMPKAVVTANASSYVVGKVTHLGSGDLFFPVSRASNYLPIKIYDVTGPNPRVTVSVEDTPGGYGIIGPGNVLVGFPYLWRSDVAGADTATYVEVQYPSSLASTAYPVVTRSVSSSKFQSMARQSHSVNAGLTKVESYFRGLRGLFSVAEGASLVQDSLALVNFYDSTKGQSWVNKSNWLSASLNSWFGVTLANNRVTGLALPKNNLSGSVPPIFIDLQSLTAIDLSNNQIERLPDISTLPNVTSMDLSGNKLDFASLITNVSIPGINYASQANLGKPLDTLLNYGTDYSLFISTKGKGNVYQWMRNGSAVSGATDSTYLLSKIGRGNMGTYICEVTNPGVPNLKLSTYDQRALAVATISGSFAEADNTPVGSGNIYLFKVNSVGAYDTTQLKALPSDGTFSFTKVILDDYVLLGKPDTVAFPTVLPSYFKSTIFWEQADTLQLQGNRNGIDIVAVAKPSQDKGTGEITGTLEDVASASGGRVEAGRRVSGAGVSCSRGESSGKVEAGKYTLVAYTLTDQDGAFALSHLSAGTYRLDMQYPGYPMDTTSFVTFTIGTAPSSRQVLVAAAVEGNKIVVKQLKITGMEEDRRFSIFPNPTKLQLNIEFKEETTNATYSITDVMGRKMKEGSLNSDAVNSIDVSSFSSGTYIVQLLQNERPIKSFQFIIE